MVETNFKLDTIMEPVRISMFLATYPLLVVLSLWHVGQAFCKRLWLLPSHPSRLFALNAGTLALLGIVNKGIADVLGDSDEVSVLFRALFLCSTIGALMPSIAASTDARDVWSNVIGVTVLILSSNFILFLLVIYRPRANSPFPDMYVVSATELKAAMASLFLLLSVLLVHAMALEEMISDVKAIVLEQLQQLGMEAKQGYRANVVVPRPWSWEVVECNARIKLMMALTSNAQNVMARSPSGAIVGALALFSVISMLYKPAAIKFYLLTSPGLIVLVCVFISVWRWARVALQEDRPFLLLAFDAEPSYWRRKVNNFRCALIAGPCAAQPNVVYSEGQYGFKEVVRRTTAFLMRCFVIPFHQLLVAVIRYTHIFSVFIMQSLIWLPAKALGCGIMVSKKTPSRETHTGNSVAEPSANFNALGVICLEGEDARIIQREFASAANLIIRRQMKKAKTKSDLKALISLLKRTQNSSSLLERSTAIHDVLHQDGAPYVQNLHVEHGYQYGWSLTLVSLLSVFTKIEVAALGAPDVSMAALNACWQAMEMMQVVDEEFVPCIVCSKETYARSLASEWSKVQKKKWRRSQEGNGGRREIKLDVVGQVLMAILEPVEKHMAEFNEARSTTCGYIMAAWSQQTVVSYTVHTVCRNLLRHWSDLENAAIANRSGGSNASEIIKAMVEHMNLLIAEVLACCLFNFPTALDMSMTEAVLISGSVSKIEKGLLLVGQGKHIWEELQWPTLHSPQSTGRGQLRKWMH